MSLEIENTEENSEDDSILEKTVKSTNKPGNEKWLNRERVLIFCSRGASYRDRHLMNDLRALLPHTKDESKFDKNEKLSEINEICEMKNCNKCIYFETRKRRDLYMWVVNIERGPSAKFLLLNVHTTRELKLSGNCLKRSRPLLSFDKTFDEQPHFQLLKELFTQIFATPNYHPKSQPFVDHIFNFSIEDNRVWFRNYQIVDESTQKLEEIGPRMVMQLVNIFEGSFRGPILYENPDFLCPNTIRRRKTYEDADKYRNRTQAKSNLNERRLTEKETYRVDEIEEEIFAANDSGIDEGVPEISQLKRQLETKKKRKNAKKRKIQTDTN